MHTIRVLPHVREQRERARDRVKRTRHGYWMEQNEADTNVVRTYLLTCRVSGSGVDPRRLTIYAPVAPCARPGQSARTALVVLWLFVRGMKHSHHPKNVYAFKHTFFPLLVGCYWRGWVMCFVTSEHKSKVRQPLSSSFHSCCVCVFFFFLPPRPVSSSTFPPHIHREE